MSDEKNVEVIEDLDDKDIGYRHGSAHLSTLLGFLYPILSLGAPLLMHLLSDDKKLKLHAAKAFNFQVLVALLMFPLGYFAPMFESLVKVFSAMAIFIQAASLLLVIFNTVQAVRKKDPNYFVSVPILPLKK